VSLIMVMKVPLISITWSLMTPRSTSADNEGQDLQQKYLMDDAGQNHAGLDQHPSLLITPIGTQTERWL